jgi:hypothetical protein
VTLGVLLNLGRLSCFYLNTKLKRLSDTNTPAYSNEESEKVERLFIEAAIHRSSYSSKQLFIEAAIHQSSYSLKRLFIEAAIH